MSPIRELTGSLLLFAVVAGGCASQHHTIRGSGQTVTRNYPVAGFDRVAVSDALNVEIRQGPAFALQMTADDNAFEGIRVRNDGRTLRIDTPNGMHLRNVRQSAVLTMPDLRAIEVSGAANVVVQSFRTANAVEVELSGASDLQGRLEVGDLNVEVSGASDMKVDGTAGRCRIGASGASDADLAGLHCSHATADLSGSADVDVTVLVELGPVDLSGASTLAYAGPATVKDVSTSGASELRRR